MPFTKGKSGNPKGRRKDFKLIEVRTIAREYTQEAVERLVAWMRSDNPKASSAAAEYLIDRGWGKAPLVIEGDIVHKFVAELPSVASNAEQWQVQQEPNKQLQ